MIDQEDLGPATISSSATIAADAVVGKDSQVGAGSSIAAGCILGEAVGLAANVTIERDTRIGRSTKVGASVYIGPAVTIGADVSVGPNAAFVGSSFDDERSGATVEAAASIGANASVVGAVTVGAGSVVGAGAVVTQDVPAFAVVVGIPAQIIGYVRSTSLNVDRRVRASALSRDELPLRIGATTALQMPTVTDIRGLLTYGEVDAHLPFVPVRYFLISDVPSSKVRGEHAHRKLHELLICVRGEVAVATDDHVERGEIVLDRPDVALHLPPMVWSRQYRYSSDAILLVLASDVYDEADYIRTYDEFVTVADG